MPSVAPPQLAAHILTVLGRNGRRITPDRAKRAAAVVAAFPAHWRQWRPDSAWDPTLDDLIAYRRALEGAP